MFVNPQKQLEKKIESIENEYKYLSGRGENSFLIDISTTPADKKQHEWKNFAKKLSSMMDKISDVEYQNPEIDYFIEKSINNLKMDSYESMEAIIKRLLNTNNTAEMVVLTNKLHKDEITADDMPFELTSTMGNFYQQIIEQVGDGGFKKEEDKRTYATRKLHDDKSDEYKFELIKRYAAQDNVSFKKNGKLTAANLLYEYLFWDEKVDKVFFESLPEYESKINKELSTAILNSRTIEEADWKIEEVYKDIA